jgi:methionyl-tRNA formyltransferase
VAAYGLILPKPILEAPKAGCINVHASLLPRWRGAAPIQRAILAGDEISGVTIMRMDEGLDTGPMLLRRELRIDGKNAGQVTEELAKLGAAALIEWLDNPTTPEVQPNVGVTYAPKPGSTGASPPKTSSGRSARSIPFQARGSRRTASG